MINNAIFCSTIVFLSNSSRLSYVAAHGRRKSWKGKFRTEISIILCLGTLMVFWVTRSGSKRTFNRLFLLFFVLTSVDINVWTSSLWVYYSLFDWYSSIERATIKIGTHYLCTCTCTYFNIGLATKWLRILNKKENSKFLLKNITLFN